MTALANWLVTLAGIYVAIGVIFAIPFVIRGVNRVDPGAADGTWGFRLIIVPGVVALWPILMRRWITGAPPPRERNAHRDATASERA